MRVLLVGAGAGFSTVDVENGLREGLRQCGAEIFEYDLGSRVGIGKKWLERIWRAKGKPEDQRPTWDDAIYRGSIESLEMALRFQVDWTIAISAMFLHPDALELLRRAGQRAAVVLTESPYNDDKQANVVDLVDRAWTNERSSVGLLRQSNPKVGYLPAAYDPARHSPDVPLEDDVPAHDVVFVGTGFIERIQLLEQVDWTGIDLGLYGHWAMLGSKHPLRKYVRGGFTDNARTAQLYRNATIGLNLYRTSMHYRADTPHVVGAQSMNPRAYELAACGVFQVAQERAEQTDVFGWSIPIFDDAAALEGLLRRFLKDARAREHHVAAALERVVPHTFHARAQQIMSDLQSASHLALLPAEAGLKKGA